MGIRIHKYIGYGLTNIQVDEKDNVIDDRFNNFGYFLSSYEDRDHIWTKERLLTYITNHSNTIYTGMTKYILNERDPNWKPYNSVIYDSEYGLPNVLLLIPPGMEHWKRYDDTIDWVEENQRNIDSDEITNWVKEIKFGIYPYYGSWIEKYTGRKIENKYIQPYNDFRGMSSTEIVNFLNKLARNAGFKDNNDMKENIIPEIPEDIILLCKFLNLFNDEETIYTLKPILYVWWG